MAVLGDSSLKRVMTIRLVANHDDATAANRDVAAVVEGLEVLPE